MNKSILRKRSSMTSVVAAHGGGIRGWQRWALNVAVVWSLIYAALGLYWAVSGQGFPYASGLVASIAGPVAGRFGPGVAWVVVIAAGIPGAVTGTAVLHGGRGLRALLIAAGVLLADRKSTRLNSSHGS